MTSKLDGSELGEVQKMTIRLITWKTEWEEGREGVKYHLESEKTNTLGRQIKSAGQPDSTWQPGAKNFKRE